MSTSYSEQRFTCEGVSVVARVPEDWDRNVAVILAHGAGQDMDSPFMTFFHEKLCDLGYLSVKFNFAYMEAGRRAPDSRKKLRATYAGVVDLVIREFDPAQLVIGGKSMGGRIASHLAAELPRVGGLVFLGYPLHPAGKPDKIRDAHLYELSIPMLFVNGTRDTLAQRDLLSGVIAKIGSRATVHWVERGDHSFRAGPRTEDNRLAAIAAIDEWLRQPSLSRTAGA